LKEKIDAVMINMAEFGVEVREKVLNRLRPGRMMLAGNNIYHESYKVLARGEDPIFGEYKRLPSGQGFKEFKVLIYDTSEEAGIPPGDVRLAPAVIKGYPQGAIDSAFAFLNTVREPAAPRVFFIPIKEYRVNKTPYDIAKKYTKDALKEFSPKIYFYDGTRPGLEAAASRAKKYLADPKTLRLVYVGQGQYGMAKGAGGVFGLGEQVQCVQEDVPEGFGDVYLHVVLGMGILDYVKYHTLNERFRDLFEKSITLDAAVAKEWQEDPVKFLSELLNGGRTLIMKVNFKDMEGLKEAHKSVMEAA